ncbi:MAG: hypothetical protein ACTSSE_08795 [Candidatus Thorarchaeota archaeon]
MTGCTIFELDAFISPESFNLTGIAMSRASDWRKRFDVILVFLSVVTLSGANRKDVLDGMPLI